MCLSRKQNEFSNSRLYDVIIGILQRPYNFVVFQCRRPKFGNVIYFDVFFFPKMSSVFRFKASIDVINMTS